jgi:hypothetical protein
MSVADELEVEQEAPLPALYEHCRTVYKLMEEEAKLIHPDQGGTTLVWEGHLTKLFQRLHLSVPYYTSVTRELKRMGCVTQKRRGGGNAPSQWIILTEPTEELFRSNGNRTGYTHNKRRTRLDMLQQQVADLARSYAKIEADYDTIIEILQEREGNV